jgi:hypothetical protein
MNDYDIDIDFTLKEIEAIERVQCWKVEDDADMRRAIHQMIIDLAELKGIDISDIGLEV